MNTQDKLELAIEALQHIGFIRRGTPQEAWGVDDMANCARTALRAIFTASEDRPALHGVAGDSCSTGNECNRLGCPECQS